MGKGTFINRKLAKGSGYAQRKARLALESKQKSKAVGISWKRATMKNDGPAGPPERNKGDHHAGS